MVDLAKIGGSGLLALLSLPAANGWFDKDWGIGVFVLLWIVWALVLYVGWPIIEAILD
ncbi:MAG TPA: hypothetical protein VM581_03490 [Magnetospirillaceae bacterium]|nr:hypothetical protein [Magnetospirillaceae bacterium]